MIILLIKITHRVDIIGHIHNISIINENGNQWLVISDETSKKEGFGYIFTMIKEWFKGPLFFCSKVQLDAISQ